MTTESFFYVYIDSRKRLSGTDSNFTYSIPLPDDHNFTHVTLLNALIPKSYYLIQVGFNTFQLQENSNIVTITVPIGNYTLSAFESIISNLLTTNSPNGWTYSISYPNSTQPDTGKLTYTVSGNSSQPSLIFGPDLFEPFGFFQNSTNTFVNNTLVSTCVIKLVSEDRLILHSSLVNNPNIDNIIISINSATNIPFSSISWINFAPEYRSHKLVNNAVKVASFSLTDEAGRILDLNGLNMNLTLAFYRKDNIFDVIRNFIKLLITPKNNPSE
ncbi:MAG TPA: hypothetical protein VHD33_08210 [Legionellaceae bacterium]|nr:hypothetical protein [Legionellaceae bacterium]